MSTPPPATIPVNRRRPPLTFLQKAALLIAAAFAGLVLVIVILNLFPAGTNTATLAAAQAWGFFGAQLVLLSLLATVLALWVASRSGLRRRITATLATASVLMLVASVAILGTIMGATAGAGGHINPFKALVFEKDSTTPDATISYAQIGGQDLTLQVFRSDKSGSKAPVMMYIHGGGWALGTADETAATSRWYANQGFLVINVNYRLSTPEHPTWDEAPADVACALTWTAAHAAHYGGDPKRLTVTGDSAGGNLSIGLGWSASQGKASSTCSQEGPVPIPQAVIGAYPVLDPEDFYANGRPWFFNSIPKDLVRDYIGGTPQRYPSRLAAVSPLSYASASAPPTLNIEPERDDFVPEKGVLRTATAARSAGVNVTVAKIPFTHHSFDSLPGSVGDQAKRTIVVSYLEQLGLAPDP